MASSSNSKDAASPAGSPSRNPVQSVSQAPDALGGTAGGAASQGQTGQGMMGLDEAPHADFVPGGVSGMGKDAAQTLKVKKEGLDPTRENEEQEREAGKLTPAEAEAISSADLPSGDPELAAPAESADRSPDFVREEEGKAPPRKPGEAA